MARRGINIRVGFDLEAFSTSAQNLSRKLDSMGSKFKNVGQSMSTSLTLPILALGGLAVKAAADYETLKTSLVTAMDGSKKAADGAFKQIEKFAAKTPYAIDEVTTAFVKLRNMGLNPSMEALKSYGNTASSMGKSLNDMVEAVADAAVGEFERLKEFGIKAKSEGDNVSFTFKGVTTTIGKNAGEIEAYLQGIGNTHFAGGIEAQSKTLNGTISTLKDNFAMAMASFGDVMLPVIKKVSDSLSGLADWMRNLSPTTKKVIIVISALAAAIGPLIFAVGALTTAFAFLAANPIILIITGVIIAVAALAAGVYYVTQNWDALTERFRDINWWKNAILDMAIYLVKINPFSVLLKGLESVLAKLGITLNLDKPVEKLVNRLEGLKVATKTYSKELKTVGEIYDEVKSKLTTDLGKESVSSASGMAASALRKLQPAIGGLKSKTVDIPFTIKADMAKIQVELLKVKTMAEVTAEQIGASISEALNNGLQSLATKGAELIGQFLGSMISGGDMTIEDFGRGILSSIGSFMQDFGAAMVSIGIAQSMLQASIASMNPVAAIAGGIALIAAGAALTNIASKGIGGSTSSEGSGGGGYSNSYGTTENIQFSTSTSVSGRDLILTTNREMSFRR